MGVIKSKSVEESYLHYTRARGPGFTTRLSPDQITERLKIVGYSEPNHIFLNKLKPLVILHFTHWLQEHSKVSHTQKKLVDAGSLRDP